MTKPDKKAWKRDRDQRDGIRASLPGRLAALAAAGHIIGKAAMKKSKK